MKRSDFFKRVILTATLTPMHVGDGEGTPQLKYSYTTLDDVPETYRSLYTQANDGTVSLTAVVGLRTQDDVNQINNALNNERTEHKASKTALNTLLAGRTVDEVQTLLDSIPALEAASQGNTPENIDALVSAKLEQTKAPMQRQLTKVETENQELKNKIATYQDRENRRIIGDAVRGFAHLSKMLPEAIADVEFMACGLFEVSENGEAITKAGIPGVTAGITPELWLTDLKASRPFYWPQSKNAGAGGGNGGNGGEPNPWAKENWNLTKQGQILRADPEKADRLAKAAGVKITG